VTCGKTQGFLAQKKVETSEVVPASRKLGLDDGIALLDGMRELVVCKGKQVQRFDLRKGLPDRDTLQKLMLGPTGNLRAPTMKVGKTVVVGFDEAVYRELTGA
jgi:arsenate reductase-like glutaredoxin family protein